MNEITLLLHAVTHTIYCALLEVVPHDRHEHRDRGAVSLEQVLWFVAAGVSVAVIAGIVWTQIKGQANKTPTAPAAP